MEVLDNIFNPAQAIINLSNMLKKGGTFVSINKENYLKQKYSRKYLKYKPQIKQTKLLYSHYTLLKTNF